MPRVTSKNLVIFLIGLTFFSAGCAKVKKIMENAYLMPDPDFADWTLLRTGTVENPEAYFQIAFPENWKAKKSKETVTPIVLVSKDYPKETCRVLPGTTTHSDPLWQISEWTFITEFQSGKRLTITDIGGKHLLEVIGYTLDGVDYLFELELPEENSEKCLEDFIQIGSSFRKIESLNESQPA